MQHKKKNTMLNKGQQRIQFTRWNINKANLEDYILLLFIDEGKDRNNPSIIATESQEHWEI